MPQSRQTITTANILAALNWTELNWTGNRTQLNWTELQRTTKCQLGKGGRRGRVRGRASKNFCTFNKVFRKAQTELCTKFAIIINAEIIWKSCENRMEKLAEILVIFHSQRGACSIGFEIVEKLQAMRYSYSSPKKGNFSVWKMLS